MVYNFLRKLKRTTSGPDDIPYWFWKTYAEILAPVMMRIFHTSLDSGKIPNVWKRADVIPCTKENLISSCSQLRPISLTDIIMHLFEKCVYQSEIADIVYNYIGDDQFAYKKGHNSTMALTEYQHMWLKSLEEGAKSELSPLTLVKHLIMSRMISCLRKSKKYQSTHILQIG